MHVALAQVSNDGCLMYEKVEQEDLIADKLKLLILQSMGISLAQLTDDTISLVIDSVTDFTLSDDFMSLQKDYPLPREIMNRLAPSNSS